MLRLVVWTVGWLAICGQLLWLVYWITFAAHHPNQTAARWVGRLLGMTSIVALQIELAVAMWWVRRQLCGLLNRAKIKPSASKR